ncbi:helix-turn-helix transcriptional regulator [Streptomyces sp. NPDC054834]
MEVTSGHTEKFPLSDDAFIIPPPHGTGSAKSVSVDDLASLVSFSRFHFVRFFKATTGSTSYILRFGSFLAELPAHLGVHAVAVSDDAPAVPGDSRPVMSNVRVQWQRIWHEY